MDRKVVNFFQVKQEIVSFNKNRLLVLWELEFPCHEARVELLKDEENICGSILFLLEPTKQINSLPCVRHLYS